MFELEGWRHWAHPEDLDALTGTASPRAVRLLPRPDPFLLGERALLPDRARQREVCRMVSSPGVILDRAEIFGTWRQRLECRRLAITACGFAPLDARTREAVAVEARAVASARGVEGATAEVRS